MATYNKTNQFIEDLYKGVHVFGTHQVKLALTNTAIVATNATVSALTSVLAATNLSGATPFNVTTTSCVQTSGALKLILVDLVLTATGAFGPFQYVGVFNDTPTSPADPMAGWYNHGSAVTLATAETYTIDFDGTNGFIAAS